MAVESRFCCPAKQAAGLGVRNRYVMKPHNFLSLEVEESIKNRLILMHTIVLYFIAYSHMAIYFKLLAWEPLQPRNPYITASLPKLFDKNTKRYLGRIFTVEIRCLELLGKVNMSESDVPIIKAALNAHLKDTGLTIKDFYLGRIDYCYNAVIPDSNKRLLLMKLLNKSVSKRGRYQRRKEPSNTLNTLYYTTTSRHFQLYDKTLERMDSGMPVLSFEQDVLRLEVQVFAGHLNYGRSNLGLQKRFHAWTDWSVRARELGEAAAIFSPGDFYTIRGACARLRKFGQSETICERIHKMLVCISRNGMDSLYARAGREKKFEASAGTISKYLRILDSYGINPITIPADACCPYMDNPFGLALVGASIFE